MAFDADAYVEAIEPPKVKWQGEWREGRPLSHAQFVRLLTQMQGLEESEEGVAHMVELFGDVIKQGFPDIGEELVEGLPIEGIMELGQDFLYSQPGVQTMDGPGPNQKTTSTDSGEASETNSKPTSDKTTMTPA